MKIILDNIIFQLQTSGGISNYWHQLINYMLLKGDLELFLYENGLSKNIFHKLLDLSNQKSLGGQSIPPPFGRYVNPRLVNETSKSLFHSSYYRTSQNKKHINVTTVHDFTYEKFFNEPRRIVHKTQKKQAILNSTGVICVSQNTKKDLLELIPRAKEKKITVIPHGVSPETFKVLEPKEEHLREVTNFSRNGYLIYVGDRKSNYKNFDKAVRTCQTTKFPLAIIGGGPLLRHELELLNDRAYKISYEHHPKIGIEKLNLLYNNAFALIYPSTYEGFGLPVIEAQMSGCPVIALNASSIPEVSGDAAILVKKDHIDGFVSAVEHLGKGENRKLMIDAGLKNAKKFTWTNTFDKTFTFYKELYDQ